MKYKLPIIIAGFVVAGSAIVYRVNAPVAQPCDDVVRIEASSTRVLDKDCV